jgi:Methyltransferase domain
MPSIEQNLNEWEKDYNWSQQGEEWSATWGGTEAQWYGAIFPRIHGFIPTGTILEIAPGYGRWTRYLKDACQQLLLVDLSQRCIEACKQRFASCDHISYHVNDGLSLSMVPENSIDFAFCFDSLVHAEMEVLQAYLEQFPSKLTRNGVGFIHHSNLGAFVDPATRGLPSAMTNPHWRAKSVSAERVAAYCDAVGLQCLSQEIVNWGGDELTDVFTCFSRKDSVLTRSNRIFNNPSFMKEANYIARLSELYTEASLFSGKPADQASGAQKTLAVHI